MENRTIIIGVLVFFLLVGALLWVFSPKDIVGPDDNEPVMKTTGIIKTNKGDVEVELYTDKAPITTANFIKLAEEGFYNGIKFHRIVPDFIVQVGDPLTKELPIDDPSIGTGGADPIEDEFHSDLSNIRGTLSMANSGPNTGSSQIFINLIDNTFLDFDKEPLTSKHPVFGAVISGMDIIESIEVGDIIEGIIINK